MQENDVIPTWIYKNGQKISDAEWIVNDKIWNVPKGQFTGKLTPLKKAGFGKLIIDEIRKFLKGWRK